MRTRHTKPVRYDYVLCTMSIETSEVKLVLEIEEKRKSGK